jgi:hypothetical protein
MGFASSLTVLYCGNSFLRTVTSILSPTFLLFSIYDNMSWKFRKSLLSIFSMISPPSIILRPLMLVVLLPPKIPAFLAGLELATSTTRKPLDSFKFSAFAKSRVISIPETPNQGCK